MKPQGTPIGRKLAMTSKAVGAAFNSALAAEGGSVPTWLILNSLKEGRWSTQLDLARSVGIEGPTLTRHLDNLEQSGFVLRQPSETDRRAVRVEITEAGEAAHGRMLVAVIDFNKRLWAGVARDDLRLFGEILTRLEANLAAPVAPAGSRRR